MKITKLIIMLLALFFVAKSSLATITDEKKSEIGIYEQLDSFVPKDALLTDENGNSVSINSIINKPTVLVLVYYTCPGICSPLLDGVAEVVSRTDLVLGKDFDILTISFNFNENYELARSKKNNYLKQVTKPVNANAWHFFTGDSMNIAKITNSVGFKYKKQGEDFIHAACLIMLSPKGKVTRYLYGTVFLPFDLKMAVVEANKGQSSPTINKVLQYCFKYDAVGRKYVFNLTKVVASVMLLGVVLFFLYLVFPQRKKVVSESKTEINQYSRKMSDYKHVSFYEAGKRKGLFGWLTSTDHKKIGLMYLYSIGLFFIVGVLLGIAMKLELIAPGETIMKPQTYNQVFTLHGVIMIFLFIIPGIPAAIGNFTLPLLIGAKDVSFPKVNLLSFYLYVLGGLMALSTLFFGQGPADTGWTFYAPYSVKTGTNVIVAVLAAFVLGFSSILTGINFLTTIHRLRCPGMTWFKMPLFPWSLYATAWIQVLATPIVGITLLMIVVERVIGLGFFDPAIGGDPVLYQHLFWIYSHPAVYIMVLPAMGIVSEIIPVFVRKSIFGYKAIVISGLAIAFVGYFVWGHHMYTSGMSTTARKVFSILTFLVAVPSGVKVFNWVATLYKGSIDLKPPLLFALSFIFLFMIGGLTGLVVGALATDIHVHDTYFVVAHFHYVMFGGTGFAFFAALHHWFPKIYGKMYSIKLANISWAILFVGFNVLYFPMFIIGILGMPRRYFDYLPEFTSLNVLSTVGSWILAVGMFLMLYNLIRGARKGEPATHNVWNGITLDWKTDSPPTLENFDEIPVVTSGPYDYKNS